MMSQPEHVGVMTESWKGHAMKRMYFPGLHSARREEVMRSVRGDMFRSGGG